MDNSYRYHKPEMDKKLDLIVSKTKKTSYHRTLHPTTTNEVIRIGKNIDKDEADYEFIGIAYFSSEGANILKKIFLVYGKNSFRLSGAEEIFSGHSSIENVSYAVFNPTPNPDIEEIKRV